MFQLGAAGESSYVAGDGWHTHQTIDNISTASYSGVSCCRNKNENSRQKEIVDAINLVGK